MKINRFSLMTIVLLLVVLVGTATTDFIGNHIIESAPSEVINSEYPINVIWGSLELSDLPDLTGVSTQQASYFVSNATIDGELIDEEDYIIAFRYSQIVGYSTGWNLDNMREVMVYGEEDLDFWSTYGLMRNGEIPTFKIYDVSEDKLYDTVMKVSHYSNDGIHFQNLILPFIELEG